MMTIPPIKSRRTLALFVLLACTCFSAAAQTTRPNIIFILADDYGVGEVSAYGADNYKTPNIDALARGSTRYTHAYTPSLCGPSRTTLQKNARQKNKR